MNEQYSQVQKNRQRFKSKINKLKISSKVSLYSIVSFFLIFFVAYISIILINMSRKSYAMEVNFNSSKYEMSLFKQLGKPLIIYVDKDNRYWWNYDQMPPMPPKPVDETGASAGNQDKYDFPELRELLTRHYEQYKNLLVIIKINRKADSKHFVNIVDEFELVAKRVVKEQPQWQVKRVPFRYFVWEWTSEDEQLFNSTS